MNLYRFLPLALAAGLVAGCGDSNTNAAGGAGNAAQDLLKQAQGALGDLSNLKLEDITKMDTSKLQDLGKSTMDAVVSKLGDVKDLASAESVKGLVEPLLEKLGAVKTALGGKLPNMEELKSTIASLTSKFTDGSDVMNVLKPLLDKLSKLVG
jgi:hypothetical protein